MESKDVRSEGRSVSLYPQDWRVVEELAERTGVGTSGALRIIVRSYDRSDQNEPECQPSKLNG